MPPPRLLVEIVSPSEENSQNYKRDYEDKCQQYAALGVSEYWLVDPERDVVLVGELVDGSYRFRAFRNGDLIGSLVFPDLALSAAQVLSGTPAN